MRFPRHALFVAGFLLTAVIPLAAQPAVAVGPAGAAAPIVTGIDLAAFQAIALGMPRADVHQRLGPPPETDGRTEIWPIRASDSYQLGFLEYLEEKVSLHGLVWKAGRCSVADLSAARRAEGLKPVSTEDGRTLFLLETADGSPCHLIYEPSEDPAQMGPLELRLTEAQMRIGAEEDLSLRDEAPATGAQ